MMNWDRKKIRVAAVMGNAVLTKAILIALGYYAGNHLDKHFGTSPFFMMGGLVVGLTIGFWWLLFVAKRMKL